MNRLTLQDLGFVSDKPNASIDAIIEEVTSSGIAFRSVLYNLIYPQTLNFFSNRNIEINMHTELKLIFPKKERKTIWADYKNSISFETPNLYYHPIVYFLIFGSMLLSIVWTFTFVVQHPELLFLTMGVSISKILIPFFVIPGALFFTIFNPYHLRWKTVDNLVDKIIDKNFRNILADQDQFKSVLKQELEKVS